MEAIRQEDCGVCIPCNTTISRGNPGVYSLKSYDNLVNVTAIFQAFSGLSRPKSKQDVNITVIAMECELHYCIRRYNSIVINGKLYEGSEELASYAIESNYNAERNETFFLKTKSCQNDSPFPCSYSITSTTILPLMQILREFLTDSGRWGNWSAGPWSIGDVCKDTIFAKTMVAAIADCSGLPYTNRRLGVLAVGFMNNMRMNIDICRGLDVKGTTQVTEAYIEKLMKIIAPADLLSGLAQNEKASKNIDSEQSFEEELHLDKGCERIDPDLRQLEKKAKTMTVRLDERRGLMVVVFFLYNKPTTLYRVHSHVKPFHTLELLLAIPLAQPRRCATPTSAPSAHEAQPVERVDEKLASVSTKVSTAVRTYKLTKYLLMFMVTCSLL
ncbi:hypothetical protein B0J14DRAFT_684438 [Halenospora varia]|nr:hypothetical protein B0J14DRAFT_684438 [Halenospora varia]